MNKHSGQGTVEGAHPHICVGEAGLSEGLRETEVTEFYCVVCVEKNWGSVRGKKRTRARVNKPLSGFRSR